MMISLKAIQISLIPNLLRSNKKKILFLRCKSINSNPGENNPTEGDTRKQDLLARIAILQTQKVRLTDFLDERSSYLTQFAEEASNEFDKIGEDALKELNEAESRIMENIESRMQAFEETAEQEKLEIEKNEKKLFDFEDEIEDGRNEGLFFQNLREKKPVDMEKVKEETEKIKEVTVDITRTDTRRNIYIVFVGLIVVAIVDSLMSSSSGWEKTTVLGFILVGLLSQLFYEQRKLFETQITTQDNKSKDDENQS
ncbi:uncharacterized protein LOC124938456 [Impatiens glandulifera]|uniref:uncharacterized protein LOC124938456 n=1 Tax=Impatiens glandulifera TaxID=253017 RepID=UPI001FB0D298|nr:uncharacterized protein LOC124938456 [Impatiens glandulifera]